MWGTNDVRFPGWEVNHADQTIQSLLGVVHLLSRTRIPIVFASPPPIFADLYAAFLAEPDPPSLYSDGVHPNAKGREIMAREIEAAIRDAIAEPSSS